MSKAFPSQSKQAPGSAAILRGAWALIESTWLSYMQWRSFFFLLAFGWMIPPLIYLFVWSTAAGEKTIGAFSRGEFVAYYLALILVNQLTFSSTNWTVGDRIRDGSLNIILLRPLPALYTTLADEIGSKVVLMMFVIPVSAGLALILRPELHVTLQNGLAFVLALALAWALRFFWGYGLALLAFWATRANALLALQDSLIFLLGGQVAPTIMLPGLLRGAAIALPFRYMLGFPVEALMGQLHGAELWTGFAYQAGWLALALILSATMWRTGLRQYTAVGG
jgi:ABC-2 type transport system permease protein